MSNNTYVQFEDVQKSYDGDTLVVKNLNLSIQEGEFITMLGPSGSGKTTCLMMLSGFEVATHGNIYINGQSINHIAPHKRDIGMVFQSYSLFPHMTVKENIGFPLKVRKAPQTEIDSKVEQALSMVSMDSFGNRMPAQLSGGQQQRIAVARALVFSPKLVLMDEPLGALDKQLREQMQYEIKHLHESLGVTIVYVTHDQSEALTMSNRIAVFNEGRIQQLASPDILYEQPENSFVAQFIGENNRLNGEVVSLDGDHCTVKVHGDQIVHAKAVNIEGIGKPTSLSIRPERIVVNPSAGSVPNTFEARIEELIYHGDHIRISASLCNSTFITKMANAGAIQKFRVGDVMQIGWSAEDCRALDYVTESS